jgi:hypothetical protein
MTNLGRKGYILDLLRERGPMDDEALSTEVIGDQGSASHVAPMTAELAADGLIVTSEIATNCWQITDKGRRARGENPDR